MTCSLDFPMPIITHTHTMHHKSSCMYRICWCGRAICTSKQYKYKYIAGISKLFCDYHLSYTRVINLTRCTNDYELYQADRSIIGYQLSNTGVIRSFCFALTDLQAIKPALCACLWILLCCR